MLIGKALGYKALALTDHETDGGTDHSGSMSCCGSNLAVPVFNGLSEEEFYILTQRKLG